MSNTVSFMTYQDVKRINQRSIDEGRNRTITDEFFEDFPTDTLFPVVMDFVHNDVEMRVELSYGSGSVFLDMGFDDYAEGVQQQNLGEVVSWIWGSNFPNKS